MKFKHHFKVWGAKAGIALVLAVLGAAAYLAFSIHYATTLRSTVYERLFLYKGYLSAQGFLHSRLAHNCPFPIVKVQR